MQTRTSGPDSAHGRYMRSLANAEPLGADEEQAAAQRIARLRAERWKALLAYAPMVSGITELIERQLGDDVPARSLERARTLAKQFQERRRLEHERSFVRAIEDLSAVLAEFDRDQIVADMVVSDLEMLDQGEVKQLNMATPPPRRTHKFRSYVRRVRLASTAYWAARNSFVRANLRLVVSMVGRYGRGRMRTEDLIQEGNLGLMKAVDRFDPEKGFRFSTYGAWWIRHAINRAVQNKARDVRLPVHVLDAIQLLAEARRNYESEFGESPSHAVLSELTQLPEKKIEALERALTSHERASRARSEAAGEDPMAMLIDPRAHGPHERLEDSQLRRRIDEAIGDLPKLERDILRRRFGLDGGESETLREIGEHYSLSRERIRQIQERAIGRIRDRLQADGLDTAPL